MKNFDPSSEDYLLVNCLTGSRLYGTANEFSDYDYRGVTLPPLEVLVDPFMNFKSQDGNENEDKSIYALGTFFNLCADNNPNLLEILWCPEEYMTYQSNIWKDVITPNRNLFLSKNIKYRFLGYSFSQIKALDRHRQWFIDPPTHKPTRDEFGLLETPTISMAWLNSMKMTMNFEIIKDNFVEEIKSEQAYRDAKRKWDNYIQWQENRNPNRKASEEKFGFDGKYASHTFRLMEEGRQLLLNGEIKFPLENAKFLLDVKNGVYSYEYIIDLAKDIELQFEEWYNISELPHKPNRNAIKEMYFSIVRSNI